MKNLNTNLLNFFTGHYKPGIIGLLGTRDAIGIAIREAQREVTRDERTSLWSHCFIFEELRLDRRGTSGNKSKSPSHLRNGAQENWIGKWCKETVENAAMIDFGLSEVEKDNVLATALQLVDEQALYPIQELLGTWLIMITKKQWIPNPFDDPHAMYCSAFVRYCYKEAGRDFLGSEISISNTTPEDIAQAGIKAGRIEIYKPDA
jgi:hypothetical protein